MPAPKLIAVEAVTVTPTYVRARVRVADGGALRTSAFPGFAERALKLLPGLVRHRCDNGTAHGIAAELADTETPHALEHVAFELMALSGSPRSLDGHTSWDFARDGRGVFEVALGYDVDLVALGAIKEAVPLVAWLLVPEGDAPHVDAAVAQLVAVRQRADQTASGE